MKKYILLFIGLWMAVAHIQGQGKKGAVYLNNGSIINGLIQELDDKVQVQTKDGSLWVFAKSEVQAIDKKRKENYQKQKGVLSMTHFSVMTGTESSPWGASVQAAPSIRTFLGYQFSPQLAVGITTGIDGYSNMPLIPLTLSLRGDLFKGSTTVYYGFDIGYAHPWLKTEGSMSWGGSISSYEGGLATSPMLGIKRYGPRGGGFFMQFAWNLQKAREREEWGGGRNEFEITYRRMQIGVGLFF